MDIFSQDALLRNVPVGLAVLKFDSEGYKPIYVSDVVTRRFGMTAQQLADMLNNNIAGFVHPDNADIVKLMFYKAGITGGYFGEIVRLRLKEGTYTWTDLRIKTMNGTAGEKAVYVGFVNLEQQIAKETRMEHFYERLLNAMDANAEGGVVVFGTKNNREPFLSYVSTGIPRMFCGTEEEIFSRFGNNVYEAIHPADRDNVVRIIEENLRAIGKFDFTCRMLNIHNEYILVHVTGAVEALESQRNIYVACTKVSEDRERQHLLQHVLDMFVRQQYQSICLLDGEKKTIEVLSYGKNGEKIFPERIADYTQTLQNVVAKYGLEQDKKEILENLALPNILKKLATQNEMEYYTRMAAYGQILYKKVWISWLDKTKKHIAFAIADYTESHVKELSQQQTLLEALKASEQANIAKSIFLSRMSHDIRTPLNAIIGFTEIALAEEKLTGKMQDYLQKIDTSSHFLLALINDVLDMSRIESGKYILHEETFAMQDLINNVSTIITDQAATKGQHYTCDLSPEVLKNYKGDVLKLQQVLVNVLGNAVKFTKSGGHINLIVKEKASYNNFRIVTFLVQDDGIGMSKEFLPHAFDSFRREAGEETKSTGTGLGLAICKNIVSLMHGNITVQSEKGKGSEFSIEVQLELPEQEETIDKSKICASDMYVQNYNFGGKHILLAEDQPLNQEIAKHLLEKVGLIVDVADNGKIACDKFAASAENYYSAVILDIRMPVMDGLEAARTIREMQRSDVKDMPLIAMSADAFEEDISKSLSNGINAHLIKPINTARLYATLAEFIPL